MSASTAAGLREAESRTERGISAPTPSGIREAKEPDQTGMIDLLATKGLLLNKAYDLVPTPVYNPSKVEQLVERGFLKMSEVDALKKSTRVLTVKGSKDLIGWVDQRVRRSFPSSK